MGEKFAAVAFNEKLLGQLLFVLQTPAAENNDELSSLAAPTTKNKEIKHYYAESCEKLFFSIQGNLNVLL